MMQRAIIITGSSGGIGRALCSAFRAEGRYVIGLDIVESDAPDTTVIADLSRFCAEPDHRQSVAESLERAIGGKPLHALINNAAVQVLANIEQLKVDDWQQTLQVNLLAPFLLTQLLLARLEAAAGSVVNIASIHATLTKPGFTAYATSKAALVGLTRSMAVELGGRVRVNAIAPAAVDTPMLRGGFADAPEKLKLLESVHPAGRIAQPQEIARSACFLTSGNAGFITGAVLQLDGGIGSRLHDPV